MMQNFRKRGLKLFSALLFGIALSGFRVACPIFCEDQTLVQTDYRDARNECREIAETRTSLQAGLEENKDHKTQLVALFSECMKSKGWDVPGPGGDVAGVRGSILPSPAPMDGGGRYVPSAGRAVAASGAGLPADATYSQADLQRAADCAWARQNSALDAIARTRAEACDIECWQRLRVNPYGLRPSACAPEYPEDRVRKRFVGNLEGEIPPAAGVVAQPAAKPAAKKPVKKKTTKTTAKKTDTKKTAAKKPFGSGVPPACSQLSPQDALDKALSSCPEEAPTPATTPSQ